MSNHLARAWKLYELNRDEDAIEAAERHLAEFPREADAFRVIAHAIKHKVATFTLPRRQPRHPNSQSAVVTP